MWSIDAIDIADLLPRTCEGGVAVTFVKENLTFSGQHDAMAELMMTELAGIAKFERALILERQREGIALAKAKGVYKGRRKALKPEEAARLRELAKTGMPKASALTSNNH